MFVQLSIVLNGSEFSVLLFDEEEWRCVDTLTPLQYNVGKVKREREGFGEVRSIVVEDGRLALVKLYKPKIKRVRERR